MRHGDFRNVSHDGGPDEAGGETTDDLGNEVELTVLGNNLQHNRLRSARMEGNSYQYNEKGEAVHVQLETKFVGHEW